MEHLGKAIDGFKCVIRMNNFVTDGYEEHVGSRVDIAATHQHCDGYGLIKVQRLWWVNSLEQCETCMEWRNIYDRTPQAFHVFMLNHDDFARFFWSKTEELKKLYPPDVSCAVSTGLATLWFLLRIYDTAVIAGFDWGKTGHYNNPNHQHWEGHNWEWEENEVKQLFDAGRVQYLNHLYQY